MFVGLSFKIMATIMARKMPAVLQRCAQFFYRLITFAKVLCFLLFVCSFFVVIVLFLALIKFWSSTVFLVHGHLTTKL